MFSFTIGDLRLKEHLYIASASVLMYYIINSVSLYQSSILMYKIMAPKVLPKTKCVISIIINYPPGAANSRT